MHAVICQGKRRRGAFQSSHCSHRRLITKCLPKLRRSLPMQRIVVIAAFLVLMSQSLAAATLDRVRESRVFRIGYRADAKPHSYRNEQGQSAGYVVDLCREVAAAITQGAPNVQVTYVLVPADQRFEAVRDGKVDILCDPSSVTLARRGWSISRCRPSSTARAYLPVNRPVERYEDLNGKRVGAAWNATRNHLREGVRRQSQRNRRSVRDHAPASACGRGQGGRLLRRPRIIARSCTRK